MLSFEKEIVAAQSPSSIIGSSFSPDLAYGSLDFALNRMSKNLILGRDYTEEEMSNENIASRVANKGPNTIIVGAFVKEPLMNFCLNSRFVPENLAFYLVMRHVRTVCENTEGLIEFYKILNCTEYADAYYSDDNLDYCRKNIEALEFLIFKRISEFSQKRSGKLKNVQVELTSDEIKANIFNKVSKNI